jgi:hypothetical protein
VFLSDQPRASAHQSFVAYLHFSGISSPSWRSADRPDQSLFFAANLHFSPTSFSCWNPPAYILGYYETTYEISSCVLMEQRTTSAKHAHLNIHNQKREQSSNANQRLVVTHQKSTIRTQANFNSTFHSFT